MRTKDQYLVDLVGSSYAQAERNLEEIRRELPRIVDIARQTARRVADQNQEK